MKIEFSFVLVLFVLLIAFSCSNDELDSQFSGSWAASGNINTGCSDPSEDGTNALECSGSDCQRYIFADSSTFIQEITIEGATQSENGTYSISGDIITFCEEDDEGTICTDIRFILSGTTLLLDSESAESGCATRTTYIKE